MARYIDMDKLSKMIEARAERLIEGKGAMLYVAKWLNLLPGADVAPRAEVAREIFEEINAIKKEYASGDIDGNELYIRLYQLEKKYTEGKK